jgi:hypothetical protein
MMSLQQVLISTVVGAVLAYAIVLVFSRTAKTTISVVDTFLIALTVGVSILLWREAGNTAALNDDPIPLVSPNDVLCPVVTYVSLGLLAAFRTTVAVSEWPRLRAILTLLSLAVNVVTI